MEFLVPRHLRGAVIVIALVAVSGTSRAQTLTTLFNFTTGLSSAGDDPYTLTLGPDGNFYGTTVSETIFKITPAGVLTALYSFANTGDGPPDTVLALGPDGNFYGTTAYRQPVGVGTPSSAGSNGTIFRITPTGALTTLYTFGGSNEAVFYEKAAVTLGADGKFYGTTLSGGAEDAGTVFKITPAGVLTTLYSFGGANGAGPEAPLTLGPDGNFYGTTGGGGAEGTGTVFKITPTGVLTTLHSFGSSAPSHPDTALTLGPDGNFYGVTANGIVFKVTPTGVLTTLYSFIIDSPSPGAALTLGTDGNFYGTVGISGLYNHGSIFSITPAGVLTTVYSFSGADGEYPQATVTLGSDGNLYGTTGGGGLYNGGTIFRFDLGNIPSIKAGGVVDAANYSSPVAPGSIGAIFGTFFIPAPASSTSFPISTVLSGVSFQFGGAPSAPLFFGSQSQFNVQIPWELAGQTQTTVSVSQNGQPSAMEILPLAVYAPGIFVVDAQTNQGAVLDTNYNLVGPANPARTGTVVQIYCTGLGPVTNQPATGAPALATPLSWTTATPIVTIGGAAAIVLFSGLVPGEVGLYQVNAQLPAASEKGDVALTISLGGVPSNTVFLATQ